MPRRKKDSGVPLQFLYGSKAPPESVVKRGMLGRVDSFNPESCCRDT